MKHNKKKNVAIIFDILLLECAKFKLQNNIDKVNSIERILKKHFSKDSILLKEYSFYNILSTVDFEMGFERAKSILNEVKKEHNKLDKNLLNEKLEALKTDLNNEFDKNFYENFVNNYKIYATIYNVLNESNVDVYSKVRLEEKIINNMMLKDKTESNDYLVDVDTIKFNKEFEKFNNKIDQLLPEQKTFLYKYINTYANDFDFLVFMNEEVSRCKQKLLRNDSMFPNKEEYNFILEKINKLPNKAYIDREDLNFVLELQQLASLIN